MLHCSDSNCLQFTCCLCTTEVTRGCSCTWNRHICYVLSCEPKFPKCVAVVFVCCVVCGFFSPFSYHSDSANLQAQDCFIYDAWFLCMTVLLRRRRRRGRRENVPPPRHPRVSPYWFWSLVDVTPRQKCHLDESLLAQAGTAQHWWQKEEFHVDQINTDVK